MRHTKITVAPTALDRPLGARRGEERIGTPANKGDWFRIENKTESAAEVYIYDEIGYWGTTATAFAETLRELDVDTITLHINSPGGEVWDGVAIYNTLVDHKAKIIVMVDGLAASAASFIAQAGDEVVMQQGSTFMIHDASSAFWGNADEMRRGADVLDKVSDNIAAIYADRAGGTKDEWRTIMKAESWYNAEETVEAGLADRVAKRASDEDEEEEKESAENRWNLGLFNYQGRSAAPDPIQVRNSALQTKEQRMPQSVSVPVGVQTATAEVEPVVTPAVETPAVEGVTPAPEVDVVTNRAPAGVLINGVQVTDLVAIQNHISALEQFASESKASAREQFVENLASEGKMFAAQVDGFKNHVKDLTDDQYASFTAMWENAPKMPALGKHGNSAHESNVASAEQGTLDRIDTLEAIVKRHRDGGLPENKVIETSSYKELQTLRAAQSKN